MSVDESNFKESKILRLMKRYEENQGKAQERIESYDSFHYMYITHVCLVLSNFFLINDVHSRKFPTNIWDLDWI
jgi:hypothetical protein